MFWKWFRTRYNRLTSSAWVRETYQPFKGWVR